MSQPTNHSSGIGLFGALFLILLTLKLAQVGAVASWSWLWVTAPLWAPLVLVLAVLLFVAAVLSGKWAVTSVASWHRRRTHLKRMMQDHS